MFKISFIFFILLILLNINVLSQDDTSAEEYYIQGKNYCIQQNWNEAIIEFEELISKYPDSRYVDDAFFWVAYCLEKIPGMQNQAFMQYDYVVNKFPDSPWTDDAKIHQISIAGEFVSSGKAQYKSFLLKALNSKNSDIQIRAALTLGKLNDKNALPILNKHTNDDDFGEIAKSLVNYLSKPDTLISQPSDSVNLKKIINLLYQKERKEKITQKPSDNIFSELYTQRYNQYKSMLRKDNDWTDEEINDFALWHILDTDKFQEYVVLSNEYDRKEWVRKFWKSHDPTPSTPKNEMKVEFERRIIYARSNFGALWNYKHMKYLPDQHLRYGWEHAPWDARGELYIKYGEPDFRSIEGWHTEEWVYYKYGVDFLVKQYMTNIYGNAISGSELSRKKYGNEFFGGMNNSWLPELQANFIYNNEMRYEHDYNANPIEDLEMNINTDSSGLLIEYTVPVDEFSSNKPINYTEEIVIFNSDEREVVRKSFQRDITDLKNDISQKTEIKLPSGDYKLTVKIQDDNSNKLGIYKSDFRIK